MACAAAPALAQSSFAENTTMNWDGAFTGIFFGLLLFSVAYNAAFFALLRERFLIWQSARAVIYVALVVGLSPLAMGPYFTPDSFARQVYINILFDMGVAVSGPFLCAYLEPGMLSRRMQRWLIRLSCAVFLTTPAMLLTDAPPAYMAFRNLVMVALLLVCSAAVVLAWRRGSRTARNQAAAWSGLTFVFGISLFYDIVLGRPFAFFLFALFPALALETMLTAVGILDRLNRLREEREDARASASALAIIASTDPLTGLANRRAIEARFAADRPVAIAIIDLDRFKAVNDHYGHDVGDRVIAAAGVALGSGKAMAGRIGGEEFALLLYDTPVIAALEAERLRQCISAVVAVEVPEVTEMVSASMGVALIDATSSFAEAMKAADVRLYAAKAGGRNRAVGQLQSAA